MRTAEQIACDLAERRRKPFTIPVEANSSILTPGKTYQGDVFYFDILSTCEAAGNKEAFSRVCELLRSAGFHIGS